MNVQQFIDQSFGRINSTEQALALLAKFGQIKDMPLDLESKYHAIFFHYTRRDLEYVRKLYMKNKENPPLPRNMPPVAGCIAWARQLYRRIEGPMKTFRDCSHVLETEEAKKHIKNYNTLARTLIEYETLWFRTWNNVIEQAKSGLQATLLVSDANNNLFVNFDPQIMQLIKEGRSLVRLKMEIPESLMQLCMREQYYKKSFYRLTALLQEKRELVDRLPNHLRRAISPHIEALNTALEPGLTALNWYVPIIINFAYKI